MFAEDKWPEGIYKDEDDARRVAAGGSGRRLYVRHGKDELFTEVDL
jgi:hypothetical protein